jgi:CRP/FNR family transcriptional regulator/CRP/FNR family cyclic AMP-dependent transcriptional regulator
MVGTAELLRRVPFFSCLHDDGIAQLSSLVIAKTYPRDNLIVLAEDEGDTLFIIVGGQVKVSIISEDGREVILAILGKGQFFGEMSLLDGKPRSATVIAIQDTELLTLRRTDFLRLIERVPELAVKVLAALTARLRKADRKIESLALMDVSGRVASALLQISEEMGSPSPRGILIRNRPTHQELANMAGTTRETVSRVIKRLEHQGYVAPSGRDLLILREKDLRADYTL